MIVYLIFFFVINVHQLEIRENFYDTIELEKYRARSSGMA